MQGQQEASNNFVLVQWNRPNGPQTETIASTELIFDGDRGVTMQRNGEIWQGQILSVSHGMDEDKAHSAATGKKRKATSDEKKAVKRRAIAERDTKPRKARSLITLAKLHYQRQRKTANYSDEGEYECHDDDEDFNDEQHPNNDYPSSQESLVEEEDRRNNYGFDDYFSDLPDEDQDTNEDIDEDKDEDDDDKFPSSSSEDEGYAEYEDKEEDEDGVSATGA